MMKRFYQLSSKLFSFQGQIQNNENNWKLTVFMMIIINNEKVVQGYPPSLTSTFKSFVSLKGFRLHLRSMCFKVVTVLECFRLIAINHKKRTTLPDAQVSLQCIQKVEFYVELSICYFFDGFVTFLWYFFSLLLLFYSNQIFTFLIIKSFCRRIEREIDERVRELNIWGQFRDDARSDQV